VKARWVCFQSLQICERVTGDTVFCRLSARRGRLYTFPAWRRGYAGFRPRSANEPAKRLAGNIEAVFRQSLPDLSECLSRTQGNFNLRQKKTEEGSLGGRRFLSEFLQGLAVEVLA